MASYYQNFQSSYIEKKPNSWEKDAEEALEIFAKIRNGEARPIDKVLTNPVQPSSQRPLKIMHEEPEEDKEF